MLDYVNDRCRYEPVVICVSEVPLVAEAEAVRVAGSRGRRVLMHLLCDLSHHLQPILKDGGGEQDLCELCAHG